MLCKQGSVKSEHCAPPPAPGRSPSCIGDSGAFLCIPMKIGVKSEHWRPRAGQVAHFSLWAAFKSPLVIGADPRALRPGLDEGLLSLPLSNSRLYTESL